MNPLTFDQIVTLAALVVSVLALLRNHSRDAKDDAEYIKAQAAESKAMADKLDTISDMSRETRDTVREMSRQLNDHSRQLARMEEQLKDHDRRLGDIEERIKIGGTD